MPSTTPDLSTATARGSSSPCGVGWSVSLAGSGSAGFVPSADSGSGQLKGSAARGRGRSVSAAGGDVDGRGSFFHIASKYDGCGSARDGSAGAGAGFRHGGSDGSNGGAGPDR